MSALDLLLLSLATLYAAFALTKTHGAFGMFTWARQHIPLGGLTACIVCAAFWFALAFYVLLQTDLNLLVWIFAAAGGAVAVAYYTGMAQQ